MKTAHNTPIGKMTAYGDLYTHIENFRPPAPITPLSRHITMIMNPKKPHKETFTNMLPPYYAIEHAPIHPSRGHSHPSVGHPGHDKPYKDDASTRRSLFPSKMVVVVQGRCVEKVTIENSRSRSTRVRPPHHRNGGK